MIIRVRVILYKTLLPPSLVNDEGRRVVDTGAWVPRIELSRHIVRGVVLDRLGQLATGFGCVGEVELICPHRSLKRNVRTSYVVQKPNWKFGETIKVRRKAAPSDRGQTLNRALTEFPSQVQPVLYHIHHRRVSAHVPPFLVKVREPRWNWNVRKRVR